MTDIDITITRAVNCKEKKEKMEAFGRTTASAVH